MNPPRFDRDEIIHAARLLITAGGITELRALEATMHGSRWRGTLSGYFDSSDKLADAVSSITSAKGIYIIPNVVKVDLLARASNRLRMVNKSDPLSSDHDIARRRWLLIDIDAQRAAGISATDDERTTARERVHLVRERLRSRGWPDPVLADSGNGWHLLYRIDLPADDSGLVRRCLETMAREFDDERVKVDTTVHNPARIWKLYGTMACKGDSTADRPHRMARLVDLPKAITVVDESLLVELAGPPETAEPVRQSNRRSGVSTFDLAEWIAYHFPEAEGPKAWNGAGEIWTLPTCPFNADHVGGCAYIGRQPSGAILAGCQHNSCTWKWHDLRAQFDPPQYRQRALRERPCAHKHRVTVPKFMPFPVDVLPEPIRSYIMITAAGMDVDPIFIILPALVTFAGAVGNSVRVLVKKGWAEPCCLWAGLIARPGSLKTQTQDAATAPMLDAQMRANKEYDVRLKEYERACEERLAAKKRGKKDDPVPPPAEPPVRRQWMVGDTTTPALVQVLKGNPRGLVSLHDELAAFFGGFGRFGKGANGAEPDAAFHKSAYNGKPHTENRKGEDGRGVYTFLPAPLECVAGAMQPDAFQRLVTRQYIEDGLASRFLWAWPPDRPGGWVDEHADDPKPSTEYAASYERLCAIPLNISEDGKLHPVYVGLSLKARPLAKEWVNALRDRMKEEGNAAVRAALAKLKGGLFRMALLFHLLDWAGRGGVGEFGSISAETLKRAITAIDWFAAEAQRVYTMLGESVGERESRELVEWIERKGGTATVRDLTHGLRAYRGDPVAAEVALSALVEGERGRWEWVQSGPRGGPPSKRFRLASTVTVTTTPTHGPMNDGNGDGDTGDALGDRCGKYVSALPELLVDLGRSGVELSAHDGQLTHRPAVLAADLSARLRLHTTAILALLLNGHAPQSGDDPEAGYIMDERLGIADDLGIAAHPGAPSWLIAVGESMQYTCTTRSNGVQP